MKKTFVILTIVLAILAAPVFAEVTASGEVDFEWAFNADDYAEKIDTNDMVLDLGGTVGDYTSISAEFEAEYEDTDGELADESGDSVVYMNQATLTQDLTGALGIESPVSVAVTFGIAGLGGDPVNYNEVAGYGDFASDGALDQGTLMTKVSLGIDPVTVDLSMYEGNNFGAEVYGTIVEGADVSVYYFSEATAGWKALDVLTAYAEAEGAPASVTDAIVAVEPTVFGINGAYAVMDGLTVGVGFENASFEEIDALELSSVTSYGLSVAYTMDALTVGAASNTTFFDVEDGPSFSETTTVSLNANYAVSEMATVFAAMAMPLDAGDADMEDVIAYEAGAKLAIDNVSYTAGYTLSSDYEGYAAGFMDGADRAGNFFMKVGASF